MQTVKDESVLGVIRQMRFDGEHAFLPPDLERKLYTKVNKILVTLGGKWKGGNTKAHVFAGKDAKEVLASVVDDGVYLDVKKDQHYFPTPTQLIWEMISLAKVKPGDLVLEPSAGRGVIVKVLVEAKCQVHAVEINLGYKIDLLKAGANDVLTQDFLALTPKPIYNAVVMNPPFGIGGQSDIAHVCHAWKFVMPGGMLVSVTSPGWTFRSNKASVTFADFVRANGSYHKNKADTFEDTSVESMTVILRKP